MTRDPYIITRQNDRDHHGLADGTAEPEQHLPRYFAKSGHVDADPKKVKKEGGGKGNWGRSGDEVLDGAFNMNHTRRRSNSSVDHANDFKTKFEAIEPDPVFEDYDEENGRYEDENSLDKAAASSHVNNKEGTGADLDHEDSSTTGTSVDSVGEADEKKI
ncbi:MAG: hypothetical protein M1831_006637 [Alyxoria varia]|nr:MAG: hypothetical protein M1831_006637 [Alyxoria varia]